MNNPEPIRNIIWNGNRKFEAQGKAVIVTDCKIGKPRMVLTRMKSASKGWFNVHFRRPGDDEFSRYAIYEPRQFQFCDGEMEARSQILLEGLFELHGLIYPEEWPFEPFERWSLTIAGGAQPFFDFLESIIRNPPEWLGQYNMNLGITIVPALARALR